MVPEVKPLLLMVGSTVTSAPNCFAIGRTAPSLVRPTRHSVSDIVAERIITRWIADVRWESNPDGWYADGSTRLRQAASFSGWQLEVDMGAPDEVVVDFVGRRFVEALAEATDWLIGRYPGRFESPSYVDDWGERK